MRSKPIVLSFILLLSIKITVAADFVIDDKVNSLRREISTTVQDWNNLSASNYDKGLKPFVKAVAGKDTSTLTDSAAASIITETIATRLFDWAISIKKVAFAMCGGSGSQPFCTIELKNEKIGNDFSIIPILSLGGKKRALNELTMVINDIKTSSSKKELEKPLLKYEGNFRSDFDGINENSYYVPEVRNPFSSSVIIQKSRTFSAKVAENPLQDKTCLACKIVNDAGENAPQGELYTADVDDVVCSSYINISPNGSCSLVKVTEGTCSPYNPSSPSLASEIFKVVTAYDTDTSLPYRTSSDIPAGLYKQVANNDFVRVNSDFTEESSDKVTISPPEGVSTWGVSYNTPDGQNVPLDERFQQFKGNTLLTSIDFGNNKLNYQTLQNFFYEARGEVTQRLKEIVLHSPNFEDIKAALKDPNVKKFKLKDAPNLKTIKILIPPFKSKVEEDNFKAEVDAINNINLLYCTYKFEVPSTPTASPPVVSTRPQPASTTSTPAEVSKPVVHENPLMSSVPDNIKKYRIYSACSG
ncbi:MAG: hypothetical protein HQK52_23885 [Oligoflexia bacterium]|nr:hypothetical protein [Oligoflexia bacterium]